MGVAATGSDDPKARLPGYSSAIRWSYPTVDQSDVRRLLADIPNDILIDRLWLAGEGAELRERVAATPRPVFPLAGRDALALGFSPGPAVGLALRAVRDWWLAGGCVADAAACREQLAAMM